MYSRKPLSNFIVGSNSNFTQNFSPESFSKYIYWLFMESYFYSKKILLLSNLLRNHLPNSIVRSNCNFTQKFSQESFSKYIYWLFMESYFYNQKILFLSNLLRNHLSNSIVRSNYKNSYPLKCTQENLFQILLLGTIPNLLKIFPKNLFSKTTINYSRNFISFFREFCTFQTHKRNSIPISIMRCNFKFTQGFFKEFFSNFTQELFKEFYHEINQATLKEFNSKHNREIPLKIHCCILVQINSNFEFTSGIHSKPTQEILIVVFNKFVYACIFWKKPIGLNWEGVN